MKCRVSKRGAEITVCVGVWKSLKVAEQVKKLLESKCYQQKDRVPKPRIHYHSFKHHLLLNNNIGSNLNSTFYDGEKMVITTMVLGMRDWSLKIIIGH